MAVVTYRDTMRRLIKNPMQRTFTFLGVTLILVIIFLMGAIRPTLTKIADLRSEIETKQDVNERLQTKISNIQTLQGVYEERQDDLSVISLFFPEDTDYSLVMASFEKVTEKYGFDMRSLKIQRDEKGKGKTSYTDMEVVNISINVTGNLKNLRHLVNHLEEMPIIPNIERVAYSPSQEEGDETKIEATISMYVYKTI